MTSLRNYLVFGKLFFAVALFLNNSLTLADPTISGIMSNVRYVHKTRLARANLYLIGFSVRVDRCGDHQKETDPE